MTLAPKTPREYRVIELVPSTSHASKPTELIQIRGHESLSLNARRAITLLWHNAHRQGIEEGKDYTIEISSLVSPGHKGYETASEAIVALMTTLIVIPLPEGGTRRVQVLGGNDMDHPNRPAGVLTYSFDKRLLEVLRDSSIWGKISLPELMSFGSKYTVSLYEHLCQWQGLNQKTSQVFTLNEFRDVLGVEQTKHVVFGDLNRNVVKPTIAELNALAPFNVAIMPRKTGKKVTHIAVSWWSKTVEERKLAYKELQRPRVGRRARISNQVEMVFPASPSPARIAQKPQSKSPKTT